jgi:hypothetical protein
MTTRTSEELPTIDLSTPLSMGASFRFPLQSADARREILWGAYFLYSSQASVGSSRWGIG